MKTNIGSGFWFYTTYQQCNRKFYIEKVLCFEPIYLSPKLLLGNGIHKGLAEFYKSRTTKEVFDAFIKKMEEQQLKFEDQKLYIEYVNTGMDILREYITKYSDDLQEYEILAVEAEFELLIGDFTFVIKPDLVWKKRSIGEIQIVDHKCSFWKRPENVFHKIAKQDQSTAYIYGWNKCFPDKHCEIFVPNILYQNKSVIECTRFEEGIYRTKYDLQSWEMGILGTINEVTQKVEALKENNPEYLFPRRGDCDGDGAYECDFAPICRTFIEGGSKSPFGFKLKEERR